LQKEREGSQAGADLFVRGKKLGEKKRCLVKTMDKHSRFAILRAANEKKEGLKGSMGASFL